VLPHWFGGRKPERPERLKGARGPARVVRTPGKKGKRLIPRDKAAEAPLSGPKGLIEKRRSGRDAREGISIAGSEQSSEERSPRALGTEKDSPGVGQLKPSGG
jgi:hypothetical protein